MQRERGHLNVFILSEDFFFNIEMISSGRSMFSLYSDEQSEKRLSYVFSVCKAVTEPKRVKHVGV